MFCIFNKNTLFLLLLFFFFVQVLTATMWRESDAAVFTWMPSHQTTLETFMPSEVRSDIRTHHIHLYVVPTSKSLYWSDGIMIRAGSEVWLYTQRSSELDLFSYVTGHHYLRKDDNDTLTSDTIENDFKELHSEVDAAFSYENHLYLIKVKHLEAHFWSCH